MDFKYEDNHVIGIAEFSELHASPDSSMGFKPYELLLTSLVTCSGSLFVNLLKKKRLEFEDLHFSAQGVRNPDEANRFVSITITAYLKLEKEIMEESLRNLERLIIDNCGMIQTIIESVDISYRIEEMTEVEGQAGE